AMAASVTPGRALRYAGAPRAASYTNRWDTAAMARAKEAGLSPQEVNAALTQVNWGADDGAARAAAGADFRAAGSACGFPAGSAGQGMNGGQPTLIASGEIGQDAPEGSSRFSPQSVPVSR
ncbi:hypothetical protein KTN05_17620, partial [Paracoccus sp. Z118]|uniref:hypothetical protein n=1 Tax=Paracoccus sp. Z118 TaxID=2851017 RepID=UPI001C2CB4E1